MPLSGTVNMGAPEWLDNAYLFCARNHSTVSDDIEFKGYCVEFSVENLFAEPIVSQDAIMRGFEIFEMGNEETPDVVLSFGIRIPFSRRKWDWLGQFVGEDVWAKFTPGEAGVAKVEEQDGTTLDFGEDDDEEDSEGDAPALTSGNEEEESEDDDLSDLNHPVAARANQKFEIPSELEHEEPTQKSGPKNLLSFHEKVVDGEQKRGRGRPRKTVVDPLTVDEAMAF